MKYNDFEIALSKPRIGRYLLAANGDVNKALRLYKQNIQLSFWTYMFAPIQFVVGGQALHKIFINRSKATTQKQIFNELDEIRSLRNRIAHHEPLCFDKHHKIFTKHTETTYQYIIKQTIWLGYDSNKLFLGIDETLKILTIIENER